MDLIAEPDAARWEHRCDKSGPVFTGSKTGIKGGAVRFAGTRSIALTALIYLAAAGWGQGGATSGAEPQPLIGAPSLAPPEELQGSWVGDDAEEPAPQEIAPPMQRAPMMGVPYAPPMYDENAHKAAALYGGYPEEYNGIDFSGDPYAGYGGSGEAGGDAGGECCGECSQGQHCGHCGCCGSDGPCGYLWNEVHSHRRLYIREEYLYWRGKGNRLPPLVTTSTDPNVPQEVAGVLGEPETQILYGGDRVNADWRSGGRITAGMWLVDGEFLGIEGHYFGLEQSVDNFFAAGDFSNGGAGPILARPFTNVVQTANPDPMLPPIVTFTPDSALIAFPNATININGVDFSGDLDGSVRVRTATNAQSAGLLLRKLMWIEFTQNWRVDGLVGYRFFRLDDGVAISDQFTLSGPQTQTIDVASYDYFAARNQFHGGELGLVGSIYRGRWSLELLGKLALGNVHEQMRISGTSFISTLGTTVETGAERLLTQPSNDGNYRRDVFAVLPETSLNLRFDVTCNVRLLAGYNFMYLSQAQRSGKAIDLDVNLSQTDGTLEGPALPTFKFKNDNGYYLHGMNAGVEIRW